MTNRNIFHLLILVTLFNAITQKSFGQKLKKHASYFRQKSRVGILVDTKIRHNEVLTGGGLVGFGISALRQNSSKKYDEPLRALEPELNPTTSIREFYNKIYSWKGKTVVVIDEPMDSLKLTQFRSTREKYLNKDVRSLKEKFGIDEVLIVSVDYGLLILYHSGFERAKESAIIKSSMVNLSDNSIIFVEKSKYFQDLPVTTTPMLKWGIKDAIDQVLKIEKKKYDGLVK